MASWFSEGPFGAGGEAGGGDDPGGGAKGLREPVYCGKSAFAGAVDSDGLLCPLVEG